MYSDSLKLEFSSHYNYKQLMDDTRSVNTIHETSTLTYSRNNCERPLSKTVETPSLFFCPDLSYSSNKTYCYRPLAVPFRPDGRVTETRRVRGDVKVERLTSLWSLRPLYHSYSIGLETGCFRVRSKFQSVVL